MQTTIEQLKQKNLWKYFLELEQIPRESGNEEGVRRWLLSWAKEHGLQAFADETGNVIIRKDATKGYEHHSPVALQGHMDMVCVKRPGSTHDFTKDPIDVMVDGDWLCAKDTSLGGDDGIAIAIALDVLSDPSVQHGPLEAIFTISEETGMNGAFGIKEKDIRSRKLLNLDSEDEGILYIGCAGGKEVEGTLDCNMETIPLDWNAYRLDVSGLLGGHSGGEIHKQRANAIKLAARLLVQQKHLMIFSIQGGTKRNVIPSSCEVGFAVPEEEEKSLTENMANLQEALKTEYRNNDPSIKLTLEKTERPRAAASTKTSKQFIRSLFLAPHGVYAYETSEELKGIVETSSNLAIVSTDGKQFKVVTSHRSSVISRRDLVAELCGEALLSGGMKVTYTGAYPAWLPNPDSPLAHFCAQAYHEYTGKEMKVTAIHAGLECGLINDTVKGMDSVSFGPQMRDIHSVDEHLSISSSERCDGFLKHLLSIIQ
ncbi:MAG: aminoacyl-histidine dipeptidase [Sphaerochaeta sp.]|jgi:dipeptidase D|nr:aminoacyl-histidine dipeptidase [Sphaerochaeta sp.]MCH3919613.1 aminoacyl-histidine dipeptidase [Sphaerochaeta sp.]MCI2044854.1 aminoacyl-histidine dipeptidase [Sphaerochaeta sp.]MCI2075909.1 aminoacyl-histidine dipeptidase [Sphaerochaeta sp.]MCI2097511.1 aminoacyl-histidine dipeptidase [Sphaerochaeta sp.]